MADTVNDNEFIPGSWATLRIYTAESIEREDLEAIDGYDYSSVRIIEVYDPNFNYIGKGAFKGCTNLEFVYITTTDEINPTVKLKIDDEAFFGCTSLSDLSLPSNISEIGYNAFYGCNCSTGQQAGRSSTCQILGKSEEAAITTLLEINYANEYSCPWIANPRGVDLYWGTMDSQWENGIYDLTIPSDITTLKPFSLSGIILDSITISSTVTEISEKAFYFSRLSKSGTITVNNNSLFKVDSGGKCLIKTESGSNDNTSNSQTTPTPVSTGTPLPIPTTEVLIFGRNISTIPESVNVIGEYAFSGDTSLTTLTIKNNITEIRDNAFLGCTNLKKIFNYSDILLSVGDSKNGMVGYYATNVYNVKVSVSNGSGTWYFDKIDNKYYLVLYSGTSTEPSFPTKVENTSNYLIGNEAFLGNTTITKINIPDTIQEIGVNAFKNCGKLNTITFSTNTGGLTINNDAFTGCSSITTVNINNIAYWLKISFLNEGANPLKASTTAGLYVNSSKITSLSPPSGITEIKKYSFSGYSGLTTITLNSEIKKLGDKCFSGTGITTIKITKNISSIGNGVFSGCTGLGSFSVESGSAYYSVPSDSYCLVSDKTIIAGCKNSNFSNITTVTKIGSGAFENCYTTSKTITIPSNIKVISDDAFKGCSGITSISIYRDLEYIGDRAFYGCSSLTTFSIKNESTGNPTKLWHIGISAFEGCSKLSSSIYLSSKTEYISSRSFCGCSLLKTVTKSTYDESSTQLSKLKWIGDHAFSGCTSFKADKFQNLKNLKQIGNYAFEKINISSFESNNKILIGKGAFKGCENLASVHIPNASVIGEEAFNGCKKLTSIILGFNLKRIESNTFRNCTKLTYLYIPPNVTELGESPFAFMGTWVSGVQNSLEPVNINFGTHSMIPTVSKKTFDGEVNDPTKRFNIIMSDGLYSSWERYYKTLYEDYRFPVLKKFSEFTYNSSKLIKFNIRDYTFLAEEGMTWNKWIGSEYSKVYCLPDNLDDVFTYKTNDDGTISQISPNHGRSFLSYYYFGTDKYYTSWPCIDDILLISKRKSTSYYFPSIITTDTKIVSNGTYTVRRVHSSDY